MPKIIKAIICILLIAGGLLIAKFLISSAPKAEKKMPPKMAQLVETKPLAAADVVIRLQLTGTVAPAEMIKLQSRVSGEIIAMSPDFIDGGKIKKGEQILTIDPVDYELALVDAESKLETARFSYTLELGRQEVAKHEWELLKSEDASDLEIELALRKPQLAADQAALKAAEAALRRAEVNLSRTKLSAPFNAVVLNRNVHIGSQASLQAELAELAGTDAYWVKVSIPVDRLSWVTIPGSAVRIVSTSGTVRNGRVIRLLGDLEEQGRMARLLVEVQDPLCIHPENADKKPLLLGEFVKVGIDGTELKKVFAIPRNSLREGSVVWIVTPDNKLDIRNVEVLWRDAKQVIIRDGLSNGEQLITSDINIPMMGMDVNTGRQSEAPQAQQTTEAK